MVRRKAVALEQHHLLEAVEEIVLLVAVSWRRRNASEVIWSVPGARPSPRSMRPGNSASSTLKRSVDHQRRMVRQHHAARADRRFFVIAATCPIMMSGAELAMVARLWCSASQ